MVDHVLLSTIDNILDIIVLVTIPVYIMIIITITKNRKDEVLKHAFFDLMISLGVADLGHIFWTILGITLPRKGWVPQFYIWLGDDLSVRLSFAGIFSFGGAQLFGVFVVALNRFTSYALPRRHDGLWNEGRILVYSIIVQWLFGVCSAVPALISRQKFAMKFAPDNRTITFAWDGANDYNFYNTMIISETLIIITIMLYIILFGIVFKRLCRKEQTIRAQSEKLALRMSIIGFVHILGATLSQHVLLASFLAWILFKYDLFSDLVFFWFLLTLGQGLFAIVNPYALLIFCTPVREHFMAMYVPKCIFCKKHGVRVHALKEEDDEEIANE